MQLLHQLKCVKTLILSLKMLHIPKHTTYFFVVVAGNDFKVNILLYIHIYILHI